MSLKVMKRSETANFVYFALVLHYTSIWYDGETMIKHINVTNFCHQVVKNLQLQSQNM